MWTFFQLKIMNATVIPVAKRPKPAPIGVPKNKIKVRQYRSNQGRDPKQQGGNELAAFVSVLGLVITFVIIILIGYFN